MALDLILSSFTAALGQLSDGRFRRVFWRGIFLTLALLIAATAGFVWLLRTFAILPWLGDVEWLGGILGLGAVLLFFGLSIFLMIPVASAITSMFLDEVAQAVEDRHYPNLPQAQTVRFADALVDTLSFLVVLIIANLLALVLYLFLPFAALFIFWAVNGFLLGREYFTMAAMRRVGRDGARDMRKLHGGTIWLAGTLMAIPLTIPLLNLLVPIVGAATFTHLFHGLKAVDARAQTS